MTSQRKSYQNHFQREEELTTSEERKKTMCVVYMRVECSERFSEVLVNDVEHTELTIESIVGTALLEVFDTVVFENITVRPAPEDDDGEDLNGTGRPTGSIAGC